MEMDWREIIRYSQKELKQKEKEKLCESLSWMEADDIELNFSDLKTLFRLSQDILKYKTEQVNNLMGKTKKKIKTKDKSTHTDSPPMSSADVLETIAHQEELIRANKEILEQLYADIAELEERKLKYNDKIVGQQDSDSSRNTLSEINEIAQLENEISKRNKHIKKLLADVKVLEEENTALKDKLPIFKEKLKEATLIIENLTQQLFTLNNNISSLKEHLGKTEQEKANLYIEVENLKKDMNDKEVKYEQVEVDVKSKLQQLKNLLKCQTEEIARLSRENSQLKDDLTISNETIKTPTKITQEELKIKELQEKLVDASDQMIKSADIIQVLSNENKQLKSIIDDVPDNSLSDHKNESDDGKEKNMIIKLKKRVKKLSDALKCSEDMIAIREKELTETAKQLQLLKSDEGINTLIEGIKKKKRDLKIKDEGIKNLVNEINNLNKLVSDLHLENETMREKLKIPFNKRIDSHKILKKYNDIENNNIELGKKVQKYENKLISLEIDNHEKNTIISNLKTMINMPDETINKSGTANDGSEREQEEAISIGYNGTNDMRAIIEENEGLRNGLSEILNLLKDNSNTSSGLLAMECPSLEAILNSLMARKSAGWFSPHMKTIMELKAAQGSKDALLCALHESRKETFKVMEKLTTEEQKSSELEKTLQQIKNNSKEENDDNVSSITDNSIGEFASWMTDINYDNINLQNVNDIQIVASKGNIWFENQFKQVIQYFHNKFSTLFQKLTTLTISTADDRNKWALQEEHYKAEIENLKSQIDEHEDTSSTCSPGLMSTTRPNFLDRKYIFLEESYKQIRTLNENIKNEHLESKKQTLNDAYEYEKKIQDLIQYVINLSDKLRNAVPLELFLKQNDVLNKLALTNRNTIEININKYCKTEDLLKRLEKDKNEILENLRKEAQCNKAEESKGTEGFNPNIDHVLLQKQLQQACNELQNKNNEIEKLEKTILDLQNTQSDIIDKTLQSEPHEYIKYLKDQIQTLNDQNKILKEQYHRAGNKVDDVLLQLQAYKSKELCDGKEINMLRHQILDLQSTGDVKASMARISGEVILAQMQNSENQNKIESLQLALNREKELRANTEEILMNRQKVFDVYTLRYETKIRNMNEVIDVLRQQYQGSLPFICVENFINKLEDLRRKSDVIDQKLNEIEDLQSNLITKHSVYNQILDLSAAKCSDNDETCIHKIKNFITDETQKLQMEHNKRKYESFEQSHKELLTRCSLLERTLIFLNQGFRLKDLSTQIVNNKKQKVDIGIEVEDIPSDDDTSSRKSRTKTLSHPKMDVKLVNESDHNINETNNKMNFQNIAPCGKRNQQTQTFLNETNSKDVKLIQTEADQSQAELNSLVERLLSEKKLQDRLFQEINAIAKERVFEITRLNKEKDEIITTLRNVSEACIQKDDSIKKLELTYESMKQEISDLQLKHIKEINKLNETANEEKQTILIEIKKIEKDKNDIVSEYMQLLSKEREDYTSSLNNLQIKLKDLQIKLDKSKTESVMNRDDGNRESSIKLTLKICNLEEKCFNLQSELDGYKADFENQQDELKRWKSLASERLAKMEQLSAQLKERHAHEVESYKAENQHWLTQLKETQREHSELRAHLTGQRTSHLQQAADKDSVIEQLRSVVNNLKTQIVNMQTMIGVSDPSFDLSAIVEVDEVSDGVSQQGSDRLELKFDSTVDFNEAQEDFAKLPCTSTAIWQEPLIERLRREKQLMGKQNAILRRQVKVLASRERRSRLDAQNLKNQVFRISAAGNKAPSAEMAALQAKVLALQAQLARRQPQPGLALWDKCKRAQQTSDRWQARYEEKCQEVKKLETSLNMSKSAVNRLEKEKRTLLSRLGDEKQDRLLEIEKQDEERSEKASPGSARAPAAAALSSAALLARVEAQQRRIVALELAEKGNEVLVTEYEKCLAEITSLRGQVLKLESTLLEAQIRSPLKSASDTQPELQYWRNYCDMLKEENMQLTLKVNSMESVPTSAHQHRINDLEQTVLTLRGLVSKLQVDQKSSSISIQKRVDSRPGSGRSGTDKVRSQIDTYRIEISNLKRTILEKDALLEKSKDMLNVAAEREDDLLRENMSLRRRLEQLTQGKGGFMSA